MYGIRVTAGRRWSRCLLACGVVSLGGCDDLISDTTEFGAVEVSTVRTNGEPVPGTELQLFIGARPMASGVTDGNGIHRFEFVPPDAYGVFAVPPEGYTRPEFLAGGPSTAVRDGIGVEEGELESVSFTYLKRGPGIVEARVADSGGEPLPGIPTDLFLSLGVLRQDTTGSSGTVRFENVPFGGYGVRIRRPDVFLEFREEPFLAVDGLIVEEGTEESVSFTLERCEGTLTAEVVDGAGEPVPGFPVVLFNADSVITETETAEDGRRTFGPLLCRDFGLALQPLRGWLIPEGRGGSFFDGIVVTRGSEQLFSFEVTRCRGTVTARVRDEDGEPASGVRVLLFDAGGALEERATDSDGLAVFDIPCDDVGVGLLPTRGWEFEDGRGVSFFDGIEVTKDSDQIFDFTVDRCAGVIRAEVLDDTGEPVPGATLVLFTFEGVVAEAESDDSGSAVFEDVGCAGYGVSVEPPEGFTVEQGRGSSFFDGLVVEDGSEQSVTFELTAG